jgi:hypothetical protein
VSLQQFDFTAPASSPQVINAAGSYFKYRTGNAGGGDTTLYLTPGVQNGQKTMLSPGQAIRLPQGKTAANWTIENALGGATITGTVIIGDGQIDDNTTTGVIQVIDGGKQRTLSNAAFIGVASATATAAVFGRAQLWNPATNPNRLVVEQITCASNSGTPQGVNLISTAAQLATNTGNGLSKLVGGAPSAALLNYDSAATNSGAGMPMFLFSLPAVDSQLVFVPHEPLIIPPGKGLTLWANQADTSVLSTWEWYEEPSV